VGCGFAAGGSEFGVCCSNTDTEKSENPALPFGGGSGAGVSVQPVGFLVVGNGQVRLMAVDSKNAFMERLVDMAPQVMENLQGILKKKHKDPCATNDLATSPEYVGVKEK
jgi:sporulation protein YtfJ